MARWFRSWWRGGLWLLPLALVAPVLHASDVQAIALSHFLKEQLPASGAPAITYGIAEDGLTSANASGRVSLEGDEFVTPQTGFLIGSVSKSFTALAVMQLVEAGSVDLDAPIGDFLDVYDDGAASAAITIRQLLSHTSGYSTYKGNLSQSDFSLDDEALTRRAVDVAAMTPAHEPGTQWEYSNANYMLAGRLIEVVSGQSYADYVEANVLAPAGMADSFVYRGADDARLAVGHEPWLGSKRPIEGNKTGLGSAPQGGIVSTGADMASYLAMMMNGEDDLISAQSKSLMMQPASDASPFYGLGWFIDTDTGTVRHSGSNPGFEALATMIPAERKGVAVMVNAGSGTGFGDTGHLRSGLSAAAIGLDYAGPPSLFWPKAIYLTFMLGPIVFVLAIVWALVKRAAIRAKTGAMRLVSLYLPLVMMAVLAAMVFIAIPRLFGVPLSAMYVFQPDLALGMIASAIAGLVWALLRLGIAYTGKPA